MRIMATNDWRRPSPTSTPSTLLTIASTRMVRTPLTNAERLDRSVTEDELLAYVTDLLQVHHWHWNHSRDSRRSNPGLPDLICVKHGRVVIAELKTQLGRISPPQQVWLDELRMN